METRLKIDFENGILDVAGDEAFVRSIYQDYKGELLKLGKSTVHTIPASAGTSNQRHGGAPAVTGGSELSDFETLSACFGAYAGEKKLKETDVALIAAAYHQVKNSLEKFGSQEVNKQLKDIGRNVSNITDALSPHLKTKPARIIQLKKAGKTKQARKEYKVTEHGITEAWRILNSAE